MHLANIKQLPKGVYLLSFCQGIGVSAAVVSVTISALAGFAITSHAGWSTLPAGVQFLSVMMTSYGSALLMQKFGRKPILLLLIACGVLSGLFGSIAMYYKSLVLLCFAHYLLGMFLTAINICRFAALDLVTTPLKATALSMVLSGGIMAALLGPFLARHSAWLVWFTDEVFSAAYWVISMLCLVVLCAMMVTKLPRKDEKATKNSAPIQLLRNYNYLYAVICGAFGYGLMNLIMIASSLEMKSVSISFATITWVIQLHVLAMFLPSLFSSQLIQRLGVYRLLMIGIVAQIISALIGMFYISTIGFFIALIFLGLAWNFLYTGGSYLATQNVPESLKFRAQGLNDFLVSVCAACGALFAGAALFFLEWPGVNLLSILLSFILLGCSIWVNYQRRFQPSVEVGGR